MVTVRIGVVLAAVMLALPASAETRSLLPASEAPGTPVAVEGQPFGEIAYVLVDTGSDAVETALIASEATAEGELIPVPWRLLEFRDDVAVAQAERETLLKVRRFDEETLHELTRPEAMAHIFSEYGAPARGREPLPPVPQPYVLVAPEYLATIVEPDVSPSGRIIGSGMRTNDGASLGRIQDLMIDTATGRIAYAVVTGPEALGYGTEWLAVPFAPLAWDLQAQAFVLDVTAAELPPPVELPRDRAEEPVDIPAEQLAEFYRSFGMQPYWE